MTIERRPPLHTRPDEEPDTDSIDDLYCYGGCTFCGHEDHKVKDCPVRKRQPWQEKLFKTGRR